jgi:hypothetical protein
MSELTSNESLKLTQLTVVAKGISNLLDAVKEMFGRSHSIFYDLESVIKGYSYYLNIAGTEDPRTKRLKYLLAKLEADNQEEKNLENEEYHERLLENAKKIKFEFPKTFTHPYAEFAKKDGFEFHGERVPNPMKNLVNDETYSLKDLVPSFRNGGKTEPLRKVMNLLGSCPDKNKRLSFYSELHGKYVSPDIFDEDNKLHPGVAKIVKKVLNSGTFNITDAQLKEYMELKEAKDEQDEMMADIKRQLKEKKRKKRKERK